MDFAGFTLYPSSLRRTIAEPDEQRRVGEILERSGLIRLLPAHQMLRIELENPVPAGTPLWCAHGVWRESAFAKIGTPEGMPRQEDGAMSPSGLVKVSIDCIDRQTPGMGSQFGFEGTYLSVLVSLREEIVWDVRGQAAK